MTARYAAPTDTHHWRRVLVVRLYATGRAMIPGMRSLTRIKIVGIVCASALLCGYSASAHASARAARAKRPTGVLRGVAGRPCNGAPWPGGVPPKVRVTVTLSRRSRVVARTTVTISGRDGHPFSFTEPVGRYTVSASNGTKPQMVVITAGQTINVQLEASPDAPCV